MAARRLLGLGVGCFGGDGASALDVIGGEWRACGFVAGAEGGEEVQEEGTGAGDIAGHIGHGCIGCVGEMESRRGRCERMADFRPWGFPMPGSNQRRWIMDMTSRREFPEYRTDLVESVSLAC